MKLNIVPYAYTSIVCSKVDWGSDFKNICATFKSL